MNQIIRLGRYSTITNMQLEEVIIQTDPGGDEIRLIGCVLRRCDLRFTRREHFINCLIVDCMLPPENTGPFIGCNIQHTLQYGYENQTLRFHNAEAKTVTLNTGNDTNEQNLHER